MPKCRRLTCKNTSLDEVTGYCKKTCHPILLEMQQTGNNHPPNSMDTNSVASFPPMAVAMANTVDMASVQETVQKINTNEDITLNEALKAMMAWNLNTNASIMKVSANVDEVTALAKSNEERLNEIEKKVGDKNECAANLSIAIQNVLKYPQGDEITVKQIVGHINAQGVNPDTDIVKVMRKGDKPATATQSEKLGTLLVEFSSSEVRSRVMRAKKVLENHTNHELQKIKISNMKSQAEINQLFFNRQLLKVSPLASQYYLAADGSLRPLAAPQQHQGPGRLPHHQLPHTRNQTPQMPPAPHNAQSAANHPPLHQMPPHHQPTFHQHQTFQQPQVPQPAGHLLPSAPPLPQQQQQPRLPVSSNGQPAWTS